MGERGSASVVPNELHDGGPAPPDREPEKSPEILEALHGLLARLDHGAGSLDDDVRALERAHGDAVYQELIWILSHLSFTASEAKSHWERIVSHRETMRNLLGDGVDLRVAMISYFLEVNRKLHNPKVIEMQLFERERASAYRDDLTGLYNYRRFREHLTREVARAGRSGRPLSLVMIDVDDFKRFNDLNGHEVGNQALADIGRLLTDSLRKSDVAARYGGEEFALILASTPKTDAQIVAERSRRRIEEQPFSGEEDLPEGLLTVSLGVATFPADAKDASELVRHADRALYVAKARGKNQVSLYGQSRRSYGRVSVALPGTFSELDDESHALTTINVSEAGLLFRTDARLSVGAIIEFTVRIEQGREVTAAGRVVHVESGGDGTYRMAVSIIDARNAARARLMALVRDSDGDEFPAIETVLADRVK